MELALQPVTDKLIEMQLGGFETLSGYFDEQPLFDKYGSISGVQEAVSRESNRLGTLCIVQHQPGEGKFYIQFSK